MRSHNTDAAEKFVEWAAGPEGAATVARIGIVPSYTDAAITDAFFRVTGMPRDALTRRAMKPSSVHLELPVSVRSSDVDQILTEEHELVMSGEKSVDKGIKEMDNRVRTEVP
jgi:multiple sugar transport system substrate-binding protein